MTVPILSTKLHIPSPPRTHVPRQHLTARLESGIPGKLILVTGPAGFGKTSLVAEWANQIQGKCLVSWLHLGESDNELTRFLSYVIAAIQVHQQDLGEAALSLLQSFPPAEIEVVLTSLINEIQSIKRSFILILDDYHLIDTTSIHYAVNFFIGNLPLNLSVVITTRTDPPLPIHQLRARGQLTEIRAEELRFNREEARSLLERILDTPFSASEIAALDRRVEGWVAGLQMVALSLQGRKERHQFIAAFSGSHRYIMDYLTEEIFNQQTPQIQKFLLQTSFLDRLSAPLCEAVLGEGSFARPESEVLSSAQQMLEYLERANLFLHPMDDERRWYRYHHLFASLLRQRLRQTWPDEIPVYLQRASDWSVVNGYIDEAIQYCLEANDIQAAAGLVQDHAMDLLKKGALSTLSSWLNKLPEETVLAQPWLSVFMGWVLLLTGNLENIERYLAMAENDKIPQEAQKDLHGHIAAIRTYASALQGNVDRAVGQANKALALLPEDNLSVRCVVAFVLGGVYFMQQDIPNALKTMEEAGRVGERAGNVHLAISALNAAGGILHRQGNLSEAERTCERALRLGTGRSGRPLPVTASIYSLLAEIYLARNDLENARQYATTGVELASQWGNMDSLASSYLALAQVAHLQGNSAEAKLALDEARHLAQIHDLTPGFEQSLAVYEAQILRGKPDRSGQGFLIEPLTERELEVLRLMAEGRSNPEIAAKLIVAVGTVKAHSSSIYRKLEARSRTEAVVKAGELGLL